MSVLKWLLNSEFLNLGFMDSCWPLIISLSSSKVMVELQIYIAVFFLEIIVLDFYFHHLQIDPDREG